MNLHPTIRQEVLNKHFLPGLPLLEFKPERALSDVEERVHRNTGSRKAKEPAGVAGPRWVDNNLNVYHAFRDVALRLIAQGRKHYGAKGIAEHLRLHTNARGEGEYKIANYAVTYLAVRFEQEYPQHAGFFKINKKG